MSAERGAILDVVVIESKERPEVTWPGLDVGGNDLSRKLKGDRMKVNVRANNGQSVRVDISAFTELTPESAIAAANIAFGAASHCDVSKREGGKLKQYRVTGFGPRRRARRVR